VASVLTGMFSVGKSGTSLGLRSGHNMLASVTEIEKCVNASLIA